MSRFQIMIGFILVFFVCAGFSLDSPKNNPVKIAVFSDPHLMSSSLNPYGEAFEAYMSSDRKLLDISPLLLEKVVDEILKTDVDIVIVPGDLTKDGELVSHVEVAQQLDRLTKAGMAVLVIAGNHDINNPHAVRFDGSVVSPVERVSPEQFKSIYASCGYDLALSHDESSLSYCYEPLPWLRIIAMDSCVYADNLATGYPYTDGQFSEERLKWILNAVQQGREKGQLVLGIMHHGIVTHFSLQQTYFGAYLLDDWQTVAREFADNGMNLVFTGHFHTQDVSMLQTAAGNVLYDVQTGSLITYPNPYRLVEITPMGEVRIKSFFIETLDGYDDFKSYSQQFVQEGISGLLPELLKEQMNKMGFSSAILNSLDRVLNTEYAGQTLSQHIGTVMADFYLGDESPSVDLTTIIAQLKQNPLNPFLFLSGMAMDALSKDTPPSDNDLTLFLPVE